MSEKTTKHLIKSSYAVPIWTAQNTTYADHFSVNMGIDAKLLMENAGKGVADAVLDVIKETSKKPRVAIFAGPGNNGADALVTARHLISNNLRVTVYMMGDGNPSNAALQYQLILLENANVKVGGNLTVIKYIDGKKAFILKNKQSYTIIIDGIFGAGLKRAPDGIALSVIEAINNYKETYSSHCTIVSIDVPSGLTLEACAPMGACIKADQTITFGYLKRVHISEPSKAFCGRCTKTAISLFTDQKTTNFFLRKKKALSGLFLPVTKSMHKWQFGHVLVLEGHDNFVGASRMSALAALRVGAGLVTIATHKKSNILPMDRAEFMHCPLDEVGDGLLNKIDSLVVGPGLSREEIYQERALSLLNRLVKGVKIVVIDADALDLLQNKSFTLSKTCMIVTPHAKEAARLLGCTAEEVERDRFLAIDALAKIKPGHDNEVIWVLKGATTLIRAINGNIFALHGDLPVLAAAGSGDVLSGIIAGLAKQTPDPLSAGLLGVSLQIEAGNVLSKSIFKGSLASELADLLPTLTKDRLVID